MVKLTLPRGEYIDWLQYDVNISPNQASRWVRIAEAYDTQTVEELGPSKLYEILDLPPSDFKDELIELAPQMTVKEIREKKKEHKDSFGNQEIIELATDATKIADAMMLSGKEVVDGLTEIDNRLSELPNHYLSLMANQLRVIPNALTNFIKKIENAIRVNKE